VVPRTFLFLPVRAMNDIVATLDKCSQCWEESGERFWIYSAATESSIDLTRVVVGLAIEMLVNRLLYEAGDRLLAILDEIPKGELVGLAIRTREWDLSENFGRGRRQGAALHGPKELLKGGMQKHSAGSQNIRGAYRTSPFSGTCQALVEGQETPNARCVPGDPGGESLGV